MNLNCIGKCNIPLPVRVGGIELAYYCADCGVLSDGQVAGIDIAGRAVAGARIPWVGIVEQFIRIAQPVPIDVIVVMIFGAVPVQDPRPHYLK